MKIIRDDKSYIQLRDLEVLLKLRCAVPIEIFETMFERQKTFTDENRDDFISFDSEEARAYLQGYESEWILNLDEYYNLSDEGFNNKRLALLATINGLNRNQFGSEQAFQVDKFKRLYRLSTLGDIKAIREGTSNIQLPVEIKREKPKTYSKDKNRNEI